ncbi:MFS transporter [Marmoricola endophyticus]|uniref:MFS transporter n=1 Tax=Marmoricola endophyticus TaxID=2040280 RepID=A0A917BGK4_9ACTN|nr:MFS transporter [Marmoricola endophyticus]GGF41971.1 MFS transporter [Marmoricola endophyticus]
MPADPYDDTAPWPRVDQGEQTSHEGPPHDNGESTARRAAEATTRGATATGRATGRAASYALRRARTASHAQGAGESGLSRVIELHAFNAAGDAAVAISLAGTIFFADPGGARGPVALFLVLTMLPFAVVAPLIGPFLDRFSHGRRWAIGATFAARGLCCIVAADAVASGSFLLYPSALGCLVASKAYGVARAATVPRLLPPTMTLVKANSRISLAGVVGAAVSGPLAAGAALAGGQWSLRYAFVVFAAGTILAILLPGRADASAGEKSVTLTGERQKLRLPVHVAFALRCNAGLRMLSGFLTIYMAFLLNQDPFPGWEDRRTLLLGLVIGAAGLGNTVGLGLGNLLRRVNPTITVVVVLLADAVAALLVAVFYSLPTAVIFGLVVGIAQALGKLALDSLIQQDTPEQYRTSAFARSETFLQLSWVIGGAIGIALDPAWGPGVGLGVLSALIVAWTAYVVLTRPRERAEPRVG